MADYVVELKNVTKRFPGVIAMHDMHIQIRPGEIHGLIGENGAGKSTLIKVLTGVHIPEEGEIFVREFCDRLVKDGYMLEVSEAEFGNNELLHEST